MIAPDAPIALSFNTSSVDVIPPLAINSNGYLINNCLYNSKEGPVSIPSFEMSVHIRYFNSPSWISSRYSNTFRLASSSHPRILIRSSKTSSPRIIFSTPYFPVHDLNKSGFLIAILPIVTWFAPLSKDLSIAESSEIPPLKSTFKFVF